MDCIIFDLDGTLIDSEQLGMRALLELAPHIDLSLDSMTSSYRGWRLQSIFEDLEMRTGRPFDNDFELAYRARFSELADRDLEAFPGVEDALSRISTPICIASSGPLAKIRRSLATTNLARFFGDNVFSAYEIRSWKPDPGLFLHAAATMGASPSRCLVVEDSDVGIKAARNANMHALHYCAGAGRPAYQPSFSDYRDLAKLLDEIERQA